MLQDFTDDIKLTDKTDNFHLVAALGTGKRVNLPDLLYALPPLKRRYFFGGRYSDTSIISILVGTSGRVTTAGFLFSRSPRPRFEYQP